MLTVGYGDMVPFTVPGKIICIINSFVGVFVTSLMIVTLTGIIELNHDQRSAFHILLQ